MPTLTTFRGGALIVALAATLTSCDSQAPNGTTSLSVQLKDAPGDVQHAFVTITEVDLVGSGGVQVLTQTPVTTDLLTLATDVLTLVQDVEVPSGTYHELRFKITGACVAVDDGNGGEHGVRDRGLRCLALRWKRDRHAPGAELCPVRAQGEDGRRRARAHRPDEDPAGGLRRDPELRARGEWVGHAPGGDRG